MFSWSHRSLSVVPHSSIDMSSTKHKCCKIDKVAWAQTFVLHGVLVARYLEVNRLHQEGVTIPEDPIAVLLELAVPTVLRTRCANDVDGENDPDDYVSLRQGCRCVYA